MSSQVKTLQTAIGPLHTTSSYAAMDNVDAITLATCSEVTAYYQQIGAAALQRKKANCVGIAAATLLLAKNLAATPPYQHIEIELCQLNNWGHVLIRFKHQNEPQGLFYDPWYQRCMTDSPATPFLIEERKFESTMQGIVNRLSFPTISLIHHVTYVKPYNTTTQQLATGYKTNKKYDCDYCVMCGSHAFSNPAKKITEPPSADGPSASCVIM